MATQHADLMGVADELWLNGRLIRKTDTAIAAMPETEETQLERETLAFLREWWSDSKAISLNTSGSTGEPKQFFISRRAMVASAQLTLATFGLHKNNTALLCLSPAFIAGKMMIVRALVGQLRLITTKVEANPLNELVTKIDFAAMVPLQLKTVVEQDPEKLNCIEQLIIGGSAIDENLVKRLSNIPLKVYHTYGMTETLSHIAIRKLNGKDASDRFFPLAGIQISPDSRGCLTAGVPFLEEAHIITNDLIKQWPDGSFVIEGRVDDVIITAGNKVHPAEVEKKLAPFIQNPFLLSSMPDSKAGERLVLVVEGNLAAAALMQLWTSIEQTLDAKEMPRHICFSETIPMLPSGKINRIQLKKWLETNTVFGE